jgi:hypothetical protein
MGFSIVTRDSQIGCRERIMEFWPITDVFRTKDDSGRKTSVLLMEMIAQIEVLPRFKSFLAER